MERKRSEAQKGQAVTPNHPKPRNLDAEDREEGLGEISTLDTKTPLSVHPRAIAAPIPFAQRG